MDQFIESSLQAVYLDIEPATLKCHLETLGVEQPSDVNFLCETDLSGVMKVIHARKLLKHWKKTDHNRYVTS